MIKVKEAETYQGASLDEVTFLEMAKNSGVAKFITREETIGNPDKITIEIKGKQEVWEVLRVIEFSSERKRMSVIAKNSEGQVVIFTKGADQTMMSRYAAGNN